MMMRIAVPLERKCFPKPYITTGKAARAMKERKKWPSARTTELLFDPCRLVRQVKQFTG